MITKDLMCAIVSAYELRLEGVHGLSHWARVLENGERLALLTGADPMVVRLFAIFHDSRRRNDHRDPNHGRRGAELAGILRERHLHLDDRAFGLLVEACERHTDGAVTGDVTLRTCWDADRLDLLRCGIMPSPRLLATEAARDPEILCWANDRAMSYFEPSFLRDEWRPMLCGI